MDEGDAPRARRPVPGLARTNERRRKACSDTLLPPELSTLGRCGNPPGGGHRSVSNLPCRNRPSEQQSPEQDEEAPLNCELTTGVPGAWTSTKYR